MNGTYKQNPESTNAIGYENKAFTGSVSDVDTDVTSKPTNGVPPAEVVANPDTARLPESPYDKLQDMRCGIGSCEPDCLQVFNNPKAVLVWLCWFAFLQGFMVNGINNVNTSTLERRFELTSSQAGFISSSYDISAAILSIPISYYGAHAHQPRMLTLAALIMACGAFVMSVPHFASGQYQLDDSQSDECYIASAVNETSMCDASDSGSSLSLWLGVFILGMILNGTGGTTLYSVGLVYLDSNVSTVSSPLYQGFLYSSAVLGPAVGYILGGYFVDYIYVDVDKVDMSSITIAADDPRFVGAWWIGFLACGALLLTVVFLLMCYPREMPAARKARLNRTVEVHQTKGNDVASQEGFGTKWRDMPKALSILLTNPVYMCLNLAGVCEGLIVSGFATFMPKFIQNQFITSAGYAGIITGAVSVPGAAGGQLVGGLVCKLAKLNVRGMLRLNVGVSITAAILCVVFICRCTSPAIAGVNTDYTNSTLGMTDPDLLSSCNADCGCTSLSYEPICGNNGVQYFSPCHAGCQKDVVNGTKVFVNCTCIEADDVDGDVMSGATMATEGVCEVDCWLMYVFLPIFFLVIFMVFMAAVPSISSTMRVIPESQRSFGIGVQWVFIRLIGSIPGPIMMGAVFDTTCEVWQDKPCEGGTGSCWIYNSMNLSTRLIILGVVVKVASTFFFILAYIFYKPPKTELKDSLSDNSGPNDIAHALENRSVSQDTVATSVPGEGHTNYGMDSSEEPVSNGQQSARAPEL